MTLTELDALTATELPVRDLADHLRLGTGFADDGAEDTALEAYLRAAISAIETRCDKALLARRYLMSVNGWRNLTGQTLPKSPVLEIESVSLIDAGGTVEVVDPAAYRLLRDEFRPGLVPTGASLPPIAVGGRSEVVFLAGYGASWSAVPAALAQAVRLLAASYFEHRTGSGSGGQKIPFAVEALIEPYRLKRIGGGAA